MAENESTNENVDPGTPAPTTPPGTITLTQAELDTMMANNRRNQSKRIQELEAEAQRGKDLNARVSDLLDSGIIDGVGDLDEFRSEAAKIVDQAKSDKERFEAAQSKSAKDLKAAQEVAELNQLKYESAMIERSISDDAAGVVVEGQGREGALEYFQLKLGPKSKVQEDGTVLVDWKVMDEETGKMTDKQVPVKVALQSMEAEPTKYGRYFKSTVNGGAGGETVDGIGRTADGNLDFANMPFEKFQELKSKNPNALSEAANKIEF